MKAAVKALINDLYEGKTNSANILLAIDFLNKLVKENEQLKAANSDLGWSMDAARDQRIESQSTTWR